MVGEPSLVVAIDPLIERQRLRARTEPDVPDLERPRSDRPRPRTPPASRRGRSMRRRAALVVAVSLVAVMYSYARGVTGLGSDSLQARTVEWARDHHLGSIIDRVERYWYDHHQAKVGGTPGAAAPTVAAGAVPADDAGATALTGPGMPAALKSPADPAVAGEGVWSALGPTIDGRIGAYVTMIRPDATHTSVLDAVVEFDPQVLSFRQYPGTTIPGSPWDRPDFVETDRRAGLVAAFAGGFRLRDSHGGMLLGGRELQPMRLGAATFAVDANGVPNVGIWGRDISPSSPLDSARQNLDLIVDGGAPVPDLASDPNRTWGFTGPADKSAVWRSGAGVTAAGALIWVGGPGLTIESLAETLVRAGAVRGMQLEINQEWVQFDTYAVNTAGTVSGTRLLAGMQHTGNRWLSVDTRDFVAVFSRAGHS
jgi:hypothetical protein